VSQPESPDEARREIPVAYADMVLLSIYKLSRCSSVGIATDLRARRLRQRSSSLGRINNFLLHIQTGCGSTHPPAQWVFTRCFPEGNAAGA
jgi:hypothetical protein